METIRQPSATILTQESDKEESRLVLFVLIDKGKKMEKELLITYFKQNIVGGQMFAGKDKYFDFFSSFTVLMFGFWLISNSAKNGNDSRNFVV